MEHIVDARGWLPLLLCGFVLLLAVRCMVGAWLRRRAGNASWRRQAAVGVVLALISPLVYNPTFAVMPVFMAIALSPVALETKTNRLRPILDGLALTCLIGSVGVLSLGYTVSLGYGPSMWPTSPRGFSFSMLQPGAYRNRLPQIGDQVQVWVPKTLNTPKFDPEVDWAAGRYHKRIFGMPGDHVLINRNGLSVNGELVADCTKRGESVPLSRWLCHVSLPSGSRQVEYDVVWGGEDWLWRETNLIVPAGKLFLLGDNLTESSDSRDHGVIPIEWVVGRHM